MVLYHCNFGFPLLSADSELDIDSATMTPGNLNATDNTEKWNKFHAPIPGYPQEVFFYSFEHENGYQSIVLKNSVLGIGVKLHFASSTLPYMTVWKTLDFGDYVLGLEPGNCLLEGQVGAREAG